MYKRIERVREWAVSFLLEQIPAPGPSCASLSLIICTRNRAPQLAKCLDYIDQATLPSGTPLDMVVVDNNSTDTTWQVCKEFEKRTAIDFRVVSSTRVGLGHARNCGIEHSRGDLIVFTDDDCYIPKDYFEKILAAVKPARCQYGVGEILLYNADDDPRVANLKIPKKRRIPKHTPIVRAGTVQGANMFFLRAVFDKAGLFNEDMGAGTPFACEDIEMVCRASHAGFTGYQLPGFAILHDHGRKIDSPEAHKAIRDYDYGRGAYYASVMARGEPRFADIWQYGTTKDTALFLKECNRLSREFAGAAQYMEFLAKNHGRAAQDGGDEPGRNETPKPMVQATRING